jgi:3-dehydroquinate synthase
MDLIQISTESKTYPLWLGSGAIRELPCFLENKNRKNKLKLLIVTDKTVADLHLETLTKALNGFEIYTFIAPSGEAAKTFDIYYNALSYALESKLDRSSVLLAFGGGAIGDLGGFIASTYMRGIPFIQIPTTILAHDSAVGGKVAINHPVGKNMIGAFYQPEAVFYDLDFTRTLSITEKRSGFAEVMKHALISDSSFYHWLVENIHSLENLDLRSLQSMLSKGIKIKGDIVSRDEKELGERAYLNFGHTLGHAIEAEVGYGKITHGEAVAIGMVFALRLSMKHFDLEFDLDSFISWLHKLGYQTNIPDGLSYHQLINRMKQDKKAVGNEIKMVLLSEIGKPILKTVSEDNIRIQMKNE